MSEPDEKKPLDMTTEEAVKFLFPKEAIEVLNITANPLNKEVAASDDDRNGDSYTQDTP